MVGRGGGLGRVRRLTKRPNRQAESVLSSAPSPLYRLRLVNAGLLLKVRSKLPQSLLRTCFTLFYFEL